MPRKAPTWWYTTSSPWPTLLSPLSTLYGVGVRARFAMTRPTRADMPVLCIGNLTVGGAGKTPVAEAAARALLARKQRPVFLTRGYGGDNCGPVTVDPDRHEASAVGDEPLLLARTAPTVVTSDRRAGARRAARLGGSVIIMDDGFQNPRLAKDLSLIVIDARAGIGNGRVLPAGPLRAPLDFQLDMADAGIIVGEGDAADEFARALEERGRPVLRGTLKPTADTDWLRGARVVAFAGIGNPCKFYLQLEQLGADLVQTLDFPDHYSFSHADARHLLDMAQETEAMLVTTEKDHVRIATRTPALIELRQRTKTLPVAFKAKDDSAFADLVASVLTKRAEFQD